MHSFDQHHPVRSIKGGYAVFFLMSRPPSSAEEGSLARRHLGMTKLRVSRTGMRLQEFRIRNLDSCASAEEGSSRFRNRPSRAHKSQAPLTARSLCLTCPFV